MSVTETVLTVIGAVVFMEAFAWWAHKYVMHGWGWAWHRDHHEPHDNVLEKNDLFAVVFGSIVIANGSNLWPSVRQRSPRAR